MLYPPELHAHGLADMIAMAEAASQILKKRKPENRNWKFEIGNGIFFEKRRRYRTGPTPFGLGVVKGSGLQWFQSIPVIVNLYSNTNYMY